MPPHLDVGQMVDLVHAISDKHLESLVLGSDVAKNDGGVRPKYLPFNG